MNNLHFPAAKCVCFHLCNIQIIHKNSSFDYKGDKRNKWLDCCKLALTGV